MATNIRIVVDEEALKHLVVTHLESILDVKLNVKDLKFQVKSKNNYRQQEWEEGELQVVVERSV